MCSDSSERDRWREIDRERERKERNLHVDQAVPVGHEALALLVHPEQKKERKRIDVYSHFIHPIITI